MFKGFHYIISLDFLVCQTNSLFVKGNACMRRCSNNDNNNDNNNNNNDNDVMNANVNVNINDNTTDIDNKHNDKP